MHRYPRYGYRSYPSVWRGVNYTYGMPFYDPLVAAAVASNLGVTGPSRIPPSTDFTNASNNSNNFVMYTFILVSIFLVVGGVLAYAKK